MDKRIPWDAPRDVLCVRLDTIGDVLMTTPAIRALREQREGRTITLLTSRIGAEVAAMVPEIDRAIPYEAPWMKPAPADRSSRADCALIERLRAGGFDAAAIFTTFSQSPLPAALTCHLAGIPNRLAHCRDKPYHLLTDWVPDAEPEDGIRHEVQRQLDLVETVGAHTQDTRLSLEIPPAAREGALAALCEAGHDPEEPWIALHPGSTAPSRRYPPELYAEAMRKLCGATGRRVVLTGHAGERELVDAIAAELGTLAVPLAGRLCLLELCGLIEAAPLLVANNSGPAHVAAAVGTPTVVLYALTNPQHTPWQVDSRVLNQDVPCRWCFASVCPEGHHACLRMVPPLEVAEAAFELLCNDSRVSPPRPRAAAAG